jgi:hypothetical protein
MNTKLNVYIGFILTLILAILAWMYVNDRSHGYVYPQAISSQESPRIDLNNKLNQDNQTRVSTPAPAVSANNTALNLQVNAPINPPVQNVDVKNNIQYVVTGNTLSLIENNSVRQTISLTPDAIESLSYTSAKQMDLAGYNNIMFPTDQDVNFDGYNDVGVFQSSGYSGVNDFYDYYLYNPKTHLLEKSATLTGVSNPRVDTIHKKIISNYRSGPQWYSTTFTYTNGSYVKSAEVID